MRRYLLNMTEDGLFTCKSPGMADENVEADENGEEGAA
jgi:hypothetical protein